MEAKTGLPIEYQKKLDKAIEWITQEVETLKKTDKNDGMVLDAHSYMVYIRPYFETLEKAVDEGRNLTFQTIIFKKLIAHLLRLMVETI